MSVDVAGKLFPNITTLIVQLISTGVMLFFLRNSYGFQYKIILEKEQILLNLKSVKPKK